MKIRIFQSAQGDCLLLTGKDGRRILVDGGMRHSYTRHVAPALGELQARGEKLDLVYVSHIDRDHISGVLQMMDDLVAWRRHDHQTEHGDPGHEPPPCTRPPDIGRIWHNAFRQQLGPNAEAVADVLAATGALLSDLDMTVLPRPEAEGLSLLAEQRREIATSVGEGIQLSQRIGREQLKIPLNPEFRGKLIFVREQQPRIELGGMAISVVGPQKKDLEQLRKEWNEWLETNSKRLEGMRRRVQALQLRPAAGDVNGEARAAAARELVSGMLGERAKVTTPNLASVMLLVEEAGKKVLLTGDGHGDDVLKGLASQGKLDDSGRIHVDVLKVQHHGSEHNIADSFWQAVSADHYVFCGNGANGNPDLRVLDGLVASRVGDGSRRPFKLWFSSSSSVVEGENEGASRARQHLADVEKRVRRLARSSGGRMTSAFNSKDSVEIKL